ncbi:RnfH family protein [Thermomonas sp.]|uniref:RnfH family protein n=1 Tax=Thermomonas sp. TaxID=1971895 RepID=UPI001E0F918B|nr:RnfH family protein [Thermomonas sp.]MBZ0087137.1 RnfH family protein [Thermomonas sp.]HRO62932.1 RnfH family protein [Thermomonas sp.]
MNTPEPDFLRIELVRAWPHRCERVEVVLGAGACVGDALAAAGWRLHGEFVALAVFSLPATEASLLHDGDRIELLRALRLDPMAARRRRAGQR